MTKPYLSMTNAEKWDWHTGVYAFRRIHLGVHRDEHTSPVDTDGIWFNPHLVDAAEQQLRDKRE